MVPSRGACGVDLTRVSSNFRASVQRQSAVRPHPGACVEHDRGGRSSTSGRAASGGDGRRRLEVTEHGAGLRERRTSVDLGHTPSCPRPMEFHQVVARDVPSHLAGGAPDLARGSTANPTSPNHGLPYARGEPVGLAATSRRRSRVPVRRSSGSRCPCRPVPPVNRTDASRPRPGRDQPARTRALRHPRGERRCRSGARSPAASVCRRPHDRTQASGREAQPRAASRRRRVHDRQGSIIDGSRR